MTMEKSPHIAVVTNVSPNHLDVHKSMEEYIRAKENIFLHQKPGGKLVLNLDDEISKSFSPAPGVSVSYFSLTQKAQEGFYQKDGAIYTSKGDVKIIDRGEIALPGLHNIDNYMAAFAATQGIAEPALWQKVAREFKGVEHRIEFVRCLEGVSYYNDSIASSPTRTIAGLKSFDKKVILIAGGYDKNIPYDELGAEIPEHVKALVLMGDTAPKIRGSVMAAGGDLPALIECDDMRDAVIAAKNAAASGDVVILSPASASFDKYKDFAERGNVFKEIVNSL